MTTIRDRVQINIALQTLFATQRTFRAMGLFDDPLIPTDIRWISATANAYSSVVGSAGTLYDACQAFFDPPQQTPNPLPDDIYLGRLILTASAPFWTAGNAETDHTVYKLVTDGSYAITDGTDTVDRTGLDFSSCNSFADCLDVLNTDLASLVAPGITGLEDAEWTLDAIGRVTLTHSVTGAAADELTVEALAVPAGTDLASATYLDAANGSTHAGFDAETPLESYEALKLVQADFWMVLMRGGETDEVDELAAQIQTEDRFFLAFESSSAATNPALTTDVASRLSTLGRVGAMFAYTDEYQDFSMAGGALGAPEGSSSFGFVDRAIPLDSGQAAYNYVLTPTQASALEDKNYNWMETVRGFKNPFPGRTVTGEEIRLALGRDWMADQMAIRIYTARIQRRILGFDNPSLAVYESEITEVLEQCLPKSSNGRQGRNIIQDFQVTIPDADTFTAAEKATHEVVIEEAFVAQVVTDAWRYQISGRLVLTDLPAAA